jgi:hypothetical protein
VVAAVDLPGGAESVAVDRVPRTPEEVATLLRGRQDGWEYLLFAAILLRELDALEPKYRDHEIGFTRPEPGPVLGADRIMSVLGAAMNEASALVANVERVFDAPAQERAFGAPGEPGDPERIAHLAERVVAVYDGLLDWAARIRGTPAEDEVKPAVALVSQFLDLPVQQFRDFVARVVAEVDRLPDLFGADGDETVVLSLTLTVTMDEGLLDEFGVECRRLEKLYGEE